MVWNEARNQLQKENWKIYKYVETKQHATEQPMVQSNQKRSQKLPWDIWKWKIQHTKT